MLGHGRPNSISGPRTAALAVLVGLAVLLVWACGPVPPGTPGASPSGSPGSSSGPTAVLTPVGSPEPSGAPSDEPGQTDTEWGRIWDALPAGFPQPIGSGPSEPIGRGPSSAELAVGASPVDVTGFYAQALPHAGYGDVSTQGPLEDGTRTVDAAGGVAGCKVQVTVTPLSGVTHVTILFAAACPFR